MPSGHQGRLSVPAKPPKSLPGIGNVLPYPERNTNLKNKSTMSYIIKRETTGRVGRYHYDHRLLELKSFDSWDEAVAEAVARKQEFEDPIYNAKVFGSERDYYVVLNNDVFECVDRYFIDYYEEDDIGHSFTVSKEEYRRILNFRDEHHKHAHSGAAGEYLRVSFVPTGLGTIVEIQCLTCGAVEDVTDYEAWSI